MTPSSSGDSISRVFAGGVSKGGVFANGVFRQLLRGRLMALLAVACAAFGAVAVVTGTLVLAETGLRGHLPAGRLAAVDVVVSGQQSVRQPEDLSVPLPERVPVPADLVGALAQLPGVRGVVGDLSFPAAVLDGAGRPVTLAGRDPALAGHGWSSTGLAETIVTGQAPTSEQEVALDAATVRFAGLAVGDLVQIVAAGQEATYRLTAVVDGVDGVFFADDVAGRIGGRVDGASAVDGADAADGARTSTVDFIALRVEAGRTEQVAEAARALLAARADATATVAPTGLIVSTGADRGDVTEPAGASGRSMLLLLAGAMGGVPLIVVGFVVAGALRVAVEGQRRELALLRAVGMTAGQLRGLVAAQGSVVTLAAAVPGAALGYVLAGQMHRLLVATATIPAGLGLVWSPLAALAAAAIVLALVQVVARTVSRRAAKAPVAVVLAEAGTGETTGTTGGSSAGSAAGAGTGGGRMSGRTLAGLLLILASVPLGAPPLFSRTVEAAASTAMAGMIAAIGVALAGPAGLRAVTAFARTRLPAEHRSGRGAASWLALANLSGYSARFASSIAALTVAVVFTITYASTQTTVLAAAEREQTAGTLADYTITAPALGGVPQGLAEQVAGVEGVQAVAPVASTTVLWTQRVLGDNSTEPVPAMVLTPAAADVLDLGITSGDLKALSGPTVALGQDTARSMKANLGSQVTLTLGDGRPVTARVVALYERSAGFGPVVVSADLVAGHLSNPLPQSLLVRTAPADTAAAGSTDVQEVGVQEDGVQESLSAWMASRAGAVLASTISTAGDGATGKQVPAETWLNFAVLAVLLGYLLLGTTNSLAATTASRRQELAALTSVGATDAQVLGTLRREALAMAGVACGAGMVLSLVPVTLLGVGFLGRPWPAGPWWLIPTTVAVVIALAWATVEVPVRRMLKPG